MSWTYFLSALLGASVYVLVGLIAWALCVNADRLDRRAAQAHRRRTTNPTTDRKADR